MDRLAKLDGFMNSVLVLVGIVLAALSGVPGIFLDRKSLAGQGWAVALLSLGAGFGITGALAQVFHPTGTIDLPWSVPGGRFFFAVDGLSALFVVQIFLLSVLGAVYGLEYWNQAAHERDGRKLRLFYGLVAAGIALLFCARNAMLFIVGLEVMALSAFLSLTAKDDDPTVREAGFLYMAATRLSTLCLFALFAVLFAATGAFDITGPMRAISQGSADAIFLLGVVGFGIKAGVMPMHVWLPGAHANAPSHVSALMSGVLIKTGVYGFLRVLTWFPQPPLWWGQLVLGLGVASGVLGVAFAIGQHDYKRLLAYHSVENIGIIWMGIGVALIGNTLGHGSMVALGLGGALLHVWNHGLFKALLFLSAGSVLHATGTREIDHLGGLAKRMPLTSGAYLLGAVAICGFPPLNGFVSELFIYLGLFQSITIPTGKLWLVGALGVPALALIGALALACFVKVFGVMFLGEPRHALVDRVTESGRRMLGPMAVLGGLCVVVGIMPFLVSPILDVAIGHFSRIPAPPLAVLSPLSVVSIVGMALLVAMGAGFAAFLAKLRKQPPAVAGTWDCGYAAPGPTMQYSSSSFAGTIVGMFSWALRPKVSAPRSHDLFPKPQTYASEVDDVVLEAFLLPTAQKGGRLFHWFGWIQRGNQHAYLLYIFLTLLTLLVLLLWR